MLIFLIEYIWSIYYSMVDFIEFYKKESDTIINSYGGHDDYKDYKAYEAYEGKI